MMRCIAAVALIACGAAWLLPDAAAQSRREKLLKRFDKNGDGKLDESERADLQAALKKYREARGGTESGGEDAAPSAPSKLDRAKLYKADAGGLELVKVALHTVRDEARDKELQLRFTFPKAAGRYPVLYFSHGAFGSKDAYGPLAEHWASHGYVVIQANHDDSRKLGVMPGDKRAVAKWETRPQDVTFIFDQLKQFEATVAGLAGKIDHDGLGVAGHSFGAHTSQLIGGTTVKQAGSSAQKSVRDPRVKAVLLISPQGKGDLLDENSWKGLTVPAMTISGSKDDSGRTGKKAEWRKDPFKYAPGPDTYLVWIDGAHHGFGGITGLKIGGNSAGPKNADHVMLVQSTGLAFLDAYVKELKPAKAYLKADTLAEASGKTVALSRK